MATAVTIYRLCVDGDMENSRDNISTPSCYELATLHLCHLNSSLWLLPPLKKEVVFGSVLMSVGAFKMNGF